MHGGRHQRLHQRRGTRTRPTFAPNTPLALSRHRRGGFSRGQGAITAELPQQAGRAFRVAGNAEAGHQMARHLLVDHDREHLRHLGASRTRRGPHFRGVPVQAAVCVCYERVAHRRRAVLSYDLPDAGVADRFSACQPCGGRAVLARPRSGACGDAASSALSDARTAGGGSAGCARPNARIRASMETAASAAAAAQTPRAGMSISNERRLLSSVCEAAATAVKGTPGVLRDARNALTSAGASRWSRRTMGRSAINPNSTAHPHRPCAASRTGDRSRYARDRVIRPILVVRGWPRGAPSKTPAADEIVSGRFWSTVSAMPQSCPSRGVRP